MSHPSIVVTGATGNIGSRVVLGLAARNREPVTAFVRDPARAASLAAAGATLRRGSFEDPESLRRGFAGAEIVVLVTAGPRLADHVDAALEAARTSGVRKIVRVSSLKASPDGPTDATRRDGRAEAAIRASGLVSVILRGHCFMQNLLHHVGSLRSGGAIYFGVGDGRIGMIDSRDIADAAVAAATSDAWDGQTLELTGPAAIDFHAVAAAIGTELGREVTYVPVPPAVAGETARKHGLDEDTAQILADYCTIYGQGWGDFTTNHVAQLTGRAPRSIADFAREVLAPAVRSLSRGAS